MKNRYNKIQDKIAFWECELAKLKKEHESKSAELDKYIEKHNNVNFAGLETSDRQKLNKIYEYFDNKYKLDFEGGLRCDERGMKLCYWLDDDPDYLIIHLASTSLNIFLSGSTSWAVKAETLQDKIKILKQTKKDIEKILK